MTMGKGGARSRSVPAKDPTSRTSERAGFVPTALPAGGYTGRIPGLTKYIPKPTSRHKAVWDELWRTPQACMWFRDKWRWPVVADLVRWSVLAESPGAPVNVATAIRQLRDDLGLSQAGLKQHGWAIAHDDLAARRTEKQAAPAESKPQRRLRGVASGAQQ